MEAKNERRATRAQRGTLLITKLALSLAGASLCAFAAAGSAFAQDAAKADAADDGKDEKSSDKDGDAKPDAEGSAEASASAGTQGLPAADAPADPKQSATPTAEPAERSSIATLPAPPGDVARLPGEAFPSTPVRGIEGGSLWLTFHGQQWPVSPFHTDVPKTQLGLSGSVWMDTGYMRVKSDKEASVGRKRWITQGRFVLRATPTYTKGDWFVQGQAELVANNDQTVNHPQVADTDDLWVRAGRWNQFDIQVGRYEGWEVYHFGMGLDLNTVEREGANDPSTAAPPAIYGLNFAQLRPSGPGNIAIHAYPTKFLRFEVLGQIGAQGNNYYAGRPVAILDLGILKVKGGLELQKSKAQVDSGDETDELRKGGGGAVQVVLNPHVELGLNGAYSIVDKIDSQGRVDLAGSTTTYSVGGFANARVMGPVIVGVGANYTRVDDLQEEPPPRSVHGEFSHFQGFGAVQVLVLDQLFIKAVGAYAKGDFAPSFTTAPPFSNTSISGRVRFMYLF